MPFFCCPMSPVFYLNACVITLVLPAVFSNILTYWEVCRFYWRPLWSSSECHMPPTIIFGNGMNEVISRKAAIEYYFLQFQGICDILCAFNPNKMHGAMMQTYQKNLTFFLPSSKMLHWALKLERSEEYGNCMHKRKKKRTKKAKHDGSRGKSLLCYLHSALVYLLPSLSASNLLRRWAGMSLWQDID